MSQYAKPNSQSSHNIFFTNGLSPLLVFTILNSQISASNLTGATAEFETLLYQFRIMGKKGCERRRKRHLKKWIFWELHI